MPAQSATASIDDRIRQLRAELNEVQHKLGTRVSTECWSRWHQLLAEYAEQSGKPPEVTVSLVGGTGAGKTTLINALLGWRLLPTKEGMPCTSAVCEIAYAEDGEFHFEVEFINQAEWDAEVARMRGDLGASLPAADEPEDERKVASGLAKAAMQKLRAVYQLGEDVGPLDCIHRHFKESQAVKVALTRGTEKSKYTPAEADKFAEHIKMFLAADQQFWPLVRSVRVRGPFEALRGGIRLIDLPGVNDPSEAREQVLRRQMKECKFVWMIFGIKRALTRDVVELMQSEDFFRQLILDGRTDRLAFIGTHSDDVNFEEACKQYQLPDDAPIEDILAARKHNLREAIAHTLTDLTYRLAGQAEEDTSKAASLANRLGNFTLFSVSARDHLAFVKKKGRDKPRLETTEQTEIPALKQYLADLAKTFGIEHHEQLIRQQLNTLLREVNRELQAHQVRMEQSQEMAAEQLKEVEAAASAEETFLAGKLTECQYGYATELAGSRSVLTERFQRGVERGRLEIEGTLSKWASLHQNTLGAVCRNGGRTTTTTGRHDLPGDLTKPLLNSIAFTWDEFFGERLGQSMKDWYEKLKTLAFQHSDRFRQSVVGRLKSGSVLVATLTRLQESTDKILTEQVEQSRARMRERIALTQKTLHERVPDKVRAYLRPAFEKAGKETGKKMKQRMIEDHIRPAVFIAARDVFQDAEQEIGTELRALLETLTRSYAEMIATVKQQARFNVTNLRRGAHELSTDHIEAERTLLKGLFGRIASLVEPLPVPSPLLVS